jgi:hypothetical protein
MRSKSKKHTWIGTVTQKIFTEAERAVACQVSAAGPHFTCFTSTNTDTSAAAAARCEHAGGSYVALGRLRNRMCHVPQQWRGHAHRQLDALLRLRDRRLHTSPTASNETAMMSEMLARGPISCSLYDEIKDFECYDGTYTIDAPLRPQTPTRHMCGEHRGLG